MISIIVPTYNRRDQLERCLQSIGALTHNSYEIVVVNDGSSDGTREYLDQLHHPRITAIHHQKNTGQSYARNSGINRAQGNILAFTDDDCLVDAEWLGELEKAMRDTHSDFVFGATYYIHKNYQGYFPERLTSNGGGVWPGGANIMFTKEILKKIGTFDPFFDTYHNEDTELAIRAMANNAHYARAPSALVFHQPETWTIKGLLSSAKNISVWPILKSRYPRHYRVFGGPAKSRIAAEPVDYLKILTLPILIPLLFIRYLFHGKRNILIFFTKWPLWILLRRWHIWKESIKNKVFVI